MAEKGYCCTLMRLLGGDVIHIPFYYLFFSVFNFFLIGTSIKKRHALRCTKSFSSLGVVNRRLDHSASSGLVPRNFCPITFSAHKICLRLFSLVVVTDFFYHVYFSLKKNDLSLQYSASSEIAASSELALPKFAPERMSSPWEIDPSFINLF